MKKIHVSDRIKGSMLGGAVGDALGFPVEFFDDAEIFRQFGENGITEYLLCGGVALISDDTQMSLFTADGMLRAESECVAATAEDYVQRVYESYLSWLFTQDSDYVPSDNIRKSELLRYRELHSSRAPGNTCLAALQSGRCGSPEEKLNLSKGCGGVMRVAPVALLLATKDCPNRFIGEVAMRIAAVTHGHLLGYLPAAFLAIALANILRETSRDYEGAMTSALSQTKGLFPPSEELDYFSALIERAVLLANDRDIDDDLEAIRELGSGWVAEETVAIAVYCALRHQDSFEGAIVASVNHSGDSDSTGAVTGNLIGAMLGYERIPEKFILNLELKDLLFKISDKLYLAGRLSP